MPGYSGIISLKSKNFKFIEIKSSMENIKSFENSFFVKRFLNKFINDKVFSEDEDVFIIIDGVILNFNNLRNKYICPNSFETVKKMYNIYGINFIKELRGNFSGVIYDKIKEEYYIFTNHIGSKYIYYFYDNENKTLIFSSDIKDVSYYMKNIGYSPELSLIGSYLLLTYGYMLEDYSLINNVKKIRPGSYLCINKDGMTQVNYFSVDNENYLDDSEEKIMKELYDRFSYAIKQEFDKDNEYNFRHIYSLSGGMDSRMIAFYSDKMGYKNQVAVTFSQNDYLDEKIAKKITSNLGHDFLFHSLDNGNYLKEIESAVEFNGGQIVYSGAAHAVSTYKLLDWNRLGLYHNGNLADVMHGDYVDAPEHTKPKPKTWAYSTKLFDKVYDISEKVAGRYPNQEVFAIYNRGINGIFNGNISTYNFTETAEPFLYQDLIEYAVRIHPKYKYKEYLFIKMTEKYMNEATLYIWEKWKKRPTIRNYELLNNPAYSFIHRGVGFINRKVKGNGKISMNPFNYWYESNYSLKKFIDNYYENNINLLEKYPELKEDCKNLFMTGKFSEKAQVITLLEFYKQVFCLEHKEKYYNEADLPNLYYVR